MQLLKQQNGAKLKPGSVSWPFPSHRPDNGPLCEQALHRNSCSAACSVTGKQKLTSVFVLKRGAVGPRGPPGPPGIAGVPGVDGIDVSLKCSLCFNRSCFSGHWASRLLDHQRAAVWVRRRHLKYNSSSASIFTQSFSVLNDSFNFTCKWDNLTEQEAELMTNIRVPVSVSSGWARRRLHSDRTTSESQFDSTNCSGC